MKTKAAKIILATTMIIIGQFSHGTELKGSEIPTSEQLGAQVFCYHAITTNKTIKELIRLASTPTVQWTEDERRFFEEETFGVKESNENFISGFKKAYEVTNELCGEDQ